MFADNYTGIFCRWLAHPSKHQCHDREQHYHRAGTAGHTISLRQASSSEKASVDGSPATPSAGSHTSGQRLIFQYRSVFWRTTKRIVPQYGILQPLIIEGNTLRDNQMHIALIKGDGSVVRNNRFQGTAPGIIPVGLAVSGTNVTIANNQFEDMEEGIRLMGNDPNLRNPPGHRRPRPSHEQSFLWGDH